ncbi:phosphotransferase family protein [Histoplasma ohiense]|nr:phosphotransferase family protein [Histoplasma ohiense (nom. inval.)]
MTKIVSALCLGQPSTAPECQTTSWAHSQMKKSLQAWIRAERIDQHPHRVTFTHGDFKAHNILVNDDGRLSGFLDWESGGWCPEYWEFTTAMRFGRKSWWYQVAMWMGGDQYMKELELELELDADIAVNLLTVDSYIGMDVGKPSLLMIVIGWVLINYSTAPNPSPSPSLIPARTETQTTTQGRRANTNKIRSWRDDEVLKYCNYQPSSCRGKTNPVARTLHVPDCPRHE